VPAVDFRFLAGSWQEDRSWTLGGAAGKKWPRVVGRAIVLPGVGRPEEAAAKALEGRTPLQIASDLQIAYSSTLDYLERAVAKGIIRRSDVILTLPPEARTSPATREDADVVERFGSISHAMGDLYEDLRDLETTLHTRIRVALENEFGSEETGWWLRGIPEDVRKKCQVRREEDPSRLDPYCYTDLIDLHDVFKSQWRLLQEQAGRLASDRPALLRNLKQLSRIRNMVMHPARGMTPTEGDFQFIKELRRSLSL
jgi:hypothetical protein